ncbi:MAG TPA: SUF system NifU family Fe-S cluster assembly protein [Candidatus Acidoferrum sp.]|nr:SUF system NifU family Fe-S cluster assembly protein [Candidatus Acidoferrum sp.]
MPMDIYVEEIISHYEHPHNKGKMEGSDADFHEDNPLCGDTLTIHIKVKSGKISDISFEGSGCAVSQAAASMLTDHVKGMQLDEVKKIGYDGVKEMLGIDPGPARMSCATLAIKTLTGAIFVYEHKKS